MKSMNREEGKKIAVMAAILIGFMMIVFTPVASAAVTSFTVTPGTGLAGAVDSYDALVTTTGVIKINISIPPGFIAVTPTTGGVQIARVDFWNSSTLDYYGYCTITANNANPTTKVDVYCKFQVGGDEVEKTTTQDVDYTAGAENTFESGFASCTSTVRIKLPEAAQKGCINLTINCADFKLDDVMIAIRQFVRNPTAAGNYDFETDDGKKATVTITAPGGRGIVFDNGRWYVDNNGDHLADDVFTYGFAGSTPLIGDFGSEDTAVVSPGSRWYVDTTHNHAANQIFMYGFAGSTPLVGDIDGDGIDDIAVASTGGKWYVDTNGDYAADLIFTYGFAGSTPLVGDFNGDGIDDIAISNSVKWWVDTDHNRAADLIFTYGFAGSTPLVGDIDRDGTDDIAVVSAGSKWFVNTDGNRVNPAANIVYTYGFAGSTPLVGDIK